MNRTFKLLNTTVWHCAFISIIADKEVEVGVLVPAWDLPGLQSESQDSLGYVERLPQREQNEQIQRSKAILKPECPGGICTVLAVRIRGGGCGKLVRGGKIWWSTHGAKPETIHIKLHSRVNSKVICHTDGLHKRMIRRNRLNANS